MSVSHPAINLLLHATKWGQFELSPFCLDVCYMSRQYFCTVLYCMCVYIQDVNGSTKVLKETQ